MQDRNRLHRTAERESRNAFSKLLTPRPGMHSNRTCGWRASISWRFLGRSSEPVVQRCRRPSDRCANRPEGSPAAVKAARHAGIGRTFRRFVHCSRFSFCPRGEELADLGQVLCTVVIGQDSGPSDAMVSVQPIARRLRFRQSVPEWNYVGLVPLCV